MNAPVNNNRSEQNDYYITVVPQAAPAVISGLDRAERSSWTRWFKVAEPYMIIVALLAFGVDLFFKYEEREYRVRDRVVSSLEEIQSELTSKDRKEFAIQFLKEKNQVLYKPKFIDDYLGSKSNGVFSQATLEKAEYLDTTFHDINIKDSFFLDSTFMNNNFYQESKKDDFEHIFYDTSFLSTSFKNSYFRNASFFSNGFDYINRVDFIENTFRELKMKGFELQNSTFSKGSIDQSAFSDLRLEHVEFDDVYIHDSSFENIKGRNLQFINSTLDDIVLNKIDVNSLLFKDSSLKNVSFKKSNLSGARFYNTGFSGYIIFNGSNILGADFRGGKALTCQMLMTADNWEDAYRDPHLDCNASIPTMPPLARN